MPNGETLLADTSAWIEFLRDTGSPACVEMTSAIRERRVVVTDPVLLEVMSGVRPSEAAIVERLLSSQRYEAVASRLDWIDAAAIFRACRREGVTIRSQIDCLIAAVAIRLDLALLHHDRDHDQIAARTRLRIAEV